MTYTRTALLPAHYYVCSAGHDEVRWAKAGGPYCWIPWCGAAGRPARALTITSGLMHVDDDPVTV